jgi:DNA-directed RNA polymerase specialized sigma24 family protein
MTLQALMQSEQRVLIARLSFALGGDRDTAEDLVQEAFNPEPVRVSGIEDT